MVLFEVCDVTLLSLLDMCMLTTMSFLLSINFNLLY